MQTISFCNLKGGSGKTTSCLSVAAELATNGYQVLLVDMDPQASLTSSAGCEPASQAAGLIKGELSSAEAVIVTDYDRLDLVPANRGLSRGERMRPAKIARRLEKLLAAAEPHYDYVCIDPPPSVGPLVVATLLASDHVVTPIAVGRGSLEGHEDVAELADRVGARPIDGAFVCMVDGRTRHHRDTVSYVQEELNGVSFDTYIRRTVSVYEAETACTPLAYYDPDATAAKDYAALTKEIIQRYE